MESPLMKPNCIRKASPPVTFCLFVIVLSYLMLRLYSDLTLTDSGIYLSRLSEVLFSPLPVHILNLWGRFAKFKRNSIAHKSSSMKD